LSGREAHTESRGMPLRFHWRMLMGGEQAGMTRAAMNRRAETGMPDLEAQIEFCRRAEESGIDSLLTDFGFSKPDPILLAAALGLATERIKFIVAYRSGLLCPTIFVQQLNTLSTLIKGRFSLNIVAGYSPEEQRYYGDFLGHDERYARTEEFLTICHSLWKRDAEVSFRGTYYKVENARLSTPFLSSERSSPEIFIGGGSLPAQRLAIRHGTCWMQIADAPEKLRPQILPALAAGIEVGLRLSIIARPTREEAIGAAHSLIDGLDTKGGDEEKEKEFVRRSDSESVKAGHELESEWLTSCLWTGAIRYIGAPAIALVGSPQEVAEAIMGYREIGVTQFIFSGWPKLDEMIFFGKEILPLIREREQAAMRAASP
jgi:alkanesulfonate monooxygenase